jgi:hypothetical protein
MRRGLSTAKGQHRRELNHRFSITAMEIRPGGRITICRLKAKATAGAAKAAFSGRSLAAVRNLMLRTIRQAPPWRATLKGSPLRFAPLRSLRDALGGSIRIRASRLRTTTKEEPLMKTLVTFCQKTGRRLRQFINRQIAKLSHKGQLRFSIALMLPLIAKVEFSYQVELNGKAGNDNKPQ